MKFLRNWKVRILLLFAVVGPGFITANVDNDAGGIFTYSLAGAHFGYTLLWTMIPITVALIVVQEMCARMGAVTGKGLSDLIREEFGLRITFLMMLGILITNFGNVIAEFNSMLARRSRHISPKMGEIVRYGSSYAGAYFVKRGRYLASELRSFLDPDVTREGLELMADDVRLLAQKEGLTAHAASVDLRCRQRATP